VCLVLVVFGFKAPFTVIQAAVEGLLLVDPELKVTRLVLGFASECHLGFALLELVQDLAVCHVTHLKVLLYRNALLIADTILTTGNHRTAGIICLADIAVDAFPAFLTLAIFILPRRALTIWE
jgi:hypothetical protein